LKEVDIFDCVVITGYHREDLENYFLTAYPDFRFRFIINHHFFETNTAYSVRLARPAFNKDDNMILMNADVFFPPELLKRILNSPSKNTLAVDIGQCGDEEVKVIDGGQNRIVAIGKKLIQENALGEFVGVASFDHSFVPHFFDSLDHLIEAGGESDYFEAGLHHLLMDHPVHYVDISDLPCLEIDFIEDLERARKIVGDIKT